MELAALVRFLMTLSPEDRAEQMNALSHGFDGLVGLRLVRVDPRRVVATLEVTEQHTQPYGLVHGGVYATLGESVCSIGAALSVFDDGANAVGVENHTRFHRGARPGTVLTADAHPVVEQVRGDLRVWTARITRDDGVLCATSRISVAVLPSGRRIAGAEVSLTPELLEASLEIAEEPDEPTTTPSADGADRSDD